ncbi:hypothetical protein [Halobaculum lipolyticum]|uniref:Archaeal Type IV pilin N-terminal domain-containing protein n=1 Tax=Halobaculum lipolyticum TaxID=3032001 RepID=A0ABD5W8R3_9EURY|nr:hypothetical protein [Halobaculum sp. DT31]
MALDPDRLLTVALLCVAVFAVAAVAALGYAATTAGDDADPMRDVRWRLEPVNDTHVRVVHDGGPTVSAASLRVTVDGIERRPDWRAPALGPGDSGVVRADPGSRVTLLWDRSRVDTVVLDRWRLPGADGG